MAALLAWVLVAWSSCGAGPLAEVGDDGMRIGAVRPIPGTEKSKTWWSIDEAQEENSWEQTYVISSVGPMVSTLYLYEGYHGVGGWRSQLIATHTARGYRFDLRDYLKSTGQDSGSYDDWSLDRFFVAGFDGQRVELGVQITGCDINRSSCSLDIGRLRMRPPAHWWPWLIATRLGIGFVAPFPG